MDNERRYIIAKCPNCGRPIMYSNNPRDKSSVEIKAISNQFNGKSCLCPKCKKMYAVIEKQSNNTIIPIVSFIYYN